MKVLPSIIFTVFFGVISTKSQYTICNLSQAEIDQRIVECLIGDAPKNNNIINKLSEELGLAPNFVFKPCPYIFNAGAIINPAKNNSRYILFDPVYFGKLYDNDMASAIFIIAHEIGHHLNGHTIPQKYISINDLQRRELEADYFAGFIMFKLGGSESDIIKSVNQLPNPTDSNSSHPQNRIRLDYALRGYLNEANKYKSELYRIRENLTKEFNREIQIKLYDDLIKSINAYAFSQNEKDLDVAMYILSKLDSKSEVIQKLTAYVNFKKKNYIQSLDYYKREYLRTREDSDLQYFLEILSNTNYEGSDITEIINDLEKNSTNPEILSSLGIYFKKTNEPKRGKEVLKRAYNLVKNKSDDLLKADIFFHYARTFYDDGLENNKGASTFAKNLLKKSKQILENYPDNTYYRFYYNAVLFHLANTQMMDEDFVGALSTYNSLLEREKTRKEYIFKANASIANIYYTTNQFPEAIQYYTNAINASNVDDFTKIYLHQRGLAYFKNDNPDLGYKDLKAACQLGFSDSCSLLEKSKK